MSLRVIGAGMGRTGTLSLKVALEKLLGGRCYHMVEVFKHPGDIAVWHEAVRGNPPDWRTFLGDCSAAVDEPPASFWRELSEVYPDALVILSLRDPDSWLESNRETTFKFIRGDAPPEPPFMAAWQAMTRDLFERSYPGLLDDDAAAIEHFQRHNGEVRNAIPASRLLEWHASDGWAPICNALGVAVPDEPFPHVNTRAEWRAREAGASNA